MSMTAAAIDKYFFIRMTIPSQCNNFILELSPFFYFKPSFLNAGKKTLKSVEVAIPAMTPDISKTGRCTIASKSV